MKTFYAILVGINEYQHDNIPTLSGCVLDVDSFADYLETTGVELNLQKLTNDRATRQAVIEAVRGLWKDPSGGSVPAKDDTILFFFSGHGCQERAHPAFEPFVRESFGGEKMTESLLCHDSLAGDTPLADKELRFLFYELSEQTGARIVLLTDACNSGGVSRSIAGAVPRLGPFAEQRRWEQFVFADILEEQAMAKVTTLEDLLPQGRHIHLAACESSQSAFELTGQQGVFTAGLINVLKHTAGAVSFHDLHSRLCFHVRQRFDQTPQLYAFEPKAGLTRPDYSLLASNFLEGVGESHGLRANLYYYNGAWYIDKGGVHGMPPPPETEKMSLDIIDMEKEEVLTGLTVTAVEPDRSKVELKDRWGAGRKVKKTETARYQVDIKGLYLTPLQVLVSGEEQGAQALKNHAKAHPEGWARRNIRLVAQRVNADYQVIASNGALMITSPRDAESPQIARPLCRNIIGWEDSSVGQLLDYLGRINHYHFVERLHNAKPKQDLQEAVAWRLHVRPGICERFPDGRSVIRQESEAVENLDRLEEATDTDQLQYKTIVVKPSSPENPDYTPFADFRIELENQSDIPLYISLLYLDKQFIVDSHNFEEEGEVIRLEPAGRPGATIKTYDFALYIDGSIRDYKWEDNFFYLKLLISNRSFELREALNQPPLPEPGPADKGTRESDNDAKVTVDPNITDWTTKMAEVRVGNPFIVH